jgi:hypothetical protein
MKTLALSIIAFLIQTITAGAVTLYYVENYSSEIQSPFHEGIANGQITFTNFEIGSPAFNLPGLSITPLIGVTLATPYIYSSSSVDGDDGSVDGVVPDVGSTCLRTNTGGRPRFVFNLIPDAQGHYPRYFGAALVVKTYYDVIANITGEVLGAKDAAGADIYSNYLIPTPNGYSSPTDVRYATFIGFYNENGISEVSFTNASCLDHLQFGFSIPEPSLLWLPVLAFGLRRRRRYTLVAFNGQLR